MSKILVVEDKESMRRMLAEALQGAGHTVTEAMDGQEAIKLLSHSRFDLVLTDLKIPKKDGLAVLRATKEEDPLTVVIVMTAYGTIETAVQAMKEGALEFLTKPFEPDHMLLLIERGLERRRLYTENLLLREGFAEHLGFPTIVGKSQQLQEVSALIQKVAMSEATVLLLGESGTGKELFARAMHYLGPRKGEPFVAINCAAIPDTLLENELFGHERGAFTGAGGLKQGKFELADRGTLFLDEVGELSQGVQAKLLRVLQDHTFERVGGTRSLEVDVRIIAATNSDLAQATKDKRFREDLFFRLNVFPVEIPPLRAHPEDIPALVEHFLQKYTREMRKEIRGISEEAMRALTRYPWPGNVRELENFVERAVILNTSGKIQVEDFSFGLPGSRIPEDTDELLSGSLHEVSARASQRAEREIIRRALAGTGGNKSKAAEMLQVSYKTLLTKIKEYGIDAEEGAG